MKYDHQGKQDQSKQGQGQQEGTGATGADALFTLINRRQFLPLASAAVTSLAVRPAALQGDQSRSPRKFVVVSDTHLGYRDQLVAEQRWQEAAKEIADLPVDFVVHLGDVVDKGREAQYPKYRAIRESIGKPVYEIPGNHDPTDLFQKYVGREIDRTIDSDWLRLILIGNAHTDSHDGFLTAEQLSQLERQLAQAAATDRLAIVCMHVTAHPNRHPDRGWYVKPQDGQTRFYEVLAKFANNCLATFHGHFHNGIRGWSDQHGIHEICFPSVLYNLDRKLESQNAPGYNLAEFRPGFTLVTIEDREMKLQYKPLGAEAVMDKLLDASRKSNR